MSAHAITLHLPEALYEHFRKRVEWTHRRLEDEVLDAVAAAASEEGELSSELISAMESMEHLADEELWRLASETLPEASHQELATLHFKQQEEGLDRNEDARRGKLISEYERAVLLRAQAARLLKERGHDVSGIVAAK